MSDIKTRWVVKSGSAFMGHERGLCEVAEYHDIDHDCVVMFDTEEQATGAARLFSYCQYGEDRDYPVVAVMSGDGWWEVSDE